MDDEGDIPVIKRFGSGFDFRPCRVGGRHPAGPSEYGPELVHVMEWYWDPRVERQVCYMKEGRECMRYDPQTHRYSYSDYSRMDLGGGNG